MSVRKRQRPGIGVREKLNWAIDSVRKVAIGAW